MRPAAKMPKLTRRSRIWIAVAVAAVLLLLIGPRFVDTYVDWLWFGELGYRSVWTTQVVTRLVIFLVVTALIGGVVFAALALACDALWQNGWRKTALAPVIGSVLLFAWFYPIISAAPLAGPDSFAVWTWLDSWR